MDNGANMWASVIELIHKAACDKAIEIAPGRYVLVWNNGLCRVISADRANFHFSVPAMNSYSGLAGTQITLSLAPSKGLQVHTLPSNRS